MQEVIARIDISTLEGRRLVKKLSREKTVTLQTNLPENIAGQKQYSVDEAYDKGLDTLSKLYNVDMRNLESE